FYRTKSHNSSSSTFRFAVSFPRPPRSPRFPYPTLFRSVQHLFLSEEFLYSIRQRNPIPEPFSLVSLHLDAVGRNRPQPPDEPVRPPLYFSVGISPQEEVSLQHFPERERGHLRVRHVVENIIQRVIRRSLFPAARDPLIDVKRKRSHRLRNHPNTSIDRRVVDGVFFVDVHTGIGRRATEDPRKIVPSKAR